MGLGQGLLVCLREPMKGNLSLQRIFKTPETFENMYHLNQIFAGHPCVHSDFPNHSSAVGLTKKGWPISLSSQFGLVDTPDTVC